MPCPWQAHPDDFAVVLPSERGAVEYRVQLVAAAADLLPAAAADAPPATAAAARDPATDARLQQWVSARRQRDWPTADRLREELRALGIEPEEAVRP